jgi:hypothetical protein
VASYESYVLPVDVHDGSKGSILPVHVGEGLSLQATGVQLRSSTGAPVRALTLRGQRGGAEVMYVGPLGGASSVVTAHSVQERGQRYLVIYENVKAEEGLRSGSKLTPGQVVATVADPTGVLVLQVRQVRRTASFAELRSPRLTDISTSIPCDPRNVLQVREKKTP